MACCGQGRMALRDATGAPAAPRAPGAGREERRVLVEYLAAAPVAVRGIVTGRLYQFDAHSVPQHVAEADAAPLLRTAFFRKLD